MKKYGLVSSACTLALLSCVTAHRASISTGTDQREPASFSTYKFCRPKSTEPINLPDAVTAQLKMWNTLYGPIYHSISYVREAIYTDTKLLKDSKSTEDPRVRLALEILNKALKNVFDYSADDRNVIVQTIWDQYRDRRDLVGYAFTMRGRLSLPYEEAFERMTASSEAAVNEASSANFNSQNLTHLLIKFQREVDSFREYAAESSGGDRDFSRLGMGLKPAVVQLLNDIYASTSEYLGAVCK